MKGDPSSDLPQGPTVMCIGLSEEDFSALPAHVIEPGAPLAMAAIAGLDSVDFSRPDAPRSIITPLVGRGFDAVEIAQRLQSKGFRGRYIAITRARPDFALIRDDVARAAPGVSFSVVSLSGGPEFHTV